MESNEFDIEVNDHVRFPFAGRGERSGKVIALFRDDKAQQVASVQTSTNMLSYIPVRRMTLVARSA